MANGKFKIHIVKKSETVFELSGILLDENSWYILPREYRNIEKHQDLMSNITVRNAINGIKPINGYRKVNIIINDEIKKQYFDEADNLCYKGIPLEEINQDSDNTNTLMKKVEELELKLEQKNSKLKGIENSFILEKFNRKRHNATEWITKFEKECSRHDIFNEEHKIETLRFFLEDTARLWYDLNLKNYELTQWIEWKNSFQRYFTDNSWTTVRHAYNYKYMGGSIIDYLLIKEKLCIEIEPNLTIQSKINLIVMGLPIKLQDKLDKEEITIEKLTKELKKINNSFTGEQKTWELKKNEEPNNWKKEEFKKVLGVDKKPCVVCEKIGLKNRYHPVQKCWNKSMSINKKINLNEEETQEDDVSEFNMNKKKLISPETSSSHQLIKIKVIIDKNKLIKAVYDNGSTCSLINERIIKSLKTKLYNSRSILKSISGMDVYKTRVNLKLNIGEIEDNLEFIVIKNDNFNYDMLLGLDAIKKFQLIHDENLKIKQKKHNEIITINKLENEENLEDKEINKNIIDDYLKEELNHLDQEKRQKIRTLINRYRECFAKGKFDVGSIKENEAQIKLKEEKFISKKPYRCSFPDRKEIDSQVSKLLEYKMIEESNSPFASPVTLAFKKEDGRRSRLCVDYCELNKIVVPEAQPFPRIEDILENVNGCKWFTALDINSAFWSIPIRLKDRKKTAFVTQKGHWQWKVLPFGYRNSPAVFQRVLSTIIRKNNSEEFCVNYIDDILIYSKTFEEHLEHIQLMFTAIRKEGFKLKLKKCNFAKHSVKFLGHILENGKIQPIKDNLIAIKEFKRPSTKKMVRQILGKINFYRKFIDHCTQRLAPLHRLLKKDVKFEWTQECEEAFENIKSYLCSTPILAIYDREKDIVIEVDASRQGLGAIMKPTQDDGILHPIGYFSKKLTPNQMKKEIIYLECLAIKEAALYWQYYLIGKEFIVSSDHKPLLNLKSKSRTDEALGDLILYLSQYNFKIFYKQGKDNIEADALSRNPVLESFENEEDCLKTLNMIQLEEIIEDQMKIKNEIENEEHVKKEGNINFKIMKNRKRIYVSKEFGFSLIDKLHKFYGHIGSRQIAEKLRTHYYFKKMDKIIINYCKNCEICIKNKSRRIRPIGKMSKLGQN